MDLAIKAAQMAARSSQSATCDKSKKKLISYCLFVRVRLPVCVRVAGSCTHHVVGRTHLRVRVRVRVSVRMRPVRMSTVVSSLDDTGTTGDSMLNFADCLECRRYVVVFLLWPSGRGFSIAINIHCFFLLWP